MVRVRVRVRVRVFFCNKSIRIPSPTAFKAVDMQGRLIRTQEISPTVCVS